MLTRALQDRGARIAVLASLHSEEKTTDPAQGQAPVACQTEMLLAVGQACAHCGLCVVYRL